MGQQAFGSQLGFAKGILAKQLASAVKRAFYRATDTLGGAGSKDALCDSALGKAL